MRLKEIRSAPFWLLVFLATLSACHSPTRGASQAGALAAEPVGKLKNRYYFDFLGLNMDDIERARQPSQPGTHYMWREPVEKTVVNLAPDHYITSHDIVWPDRVTFRASDVPGARAQQYVVYIQPGHFVEEFVDSDNILNQLILNAINWQS